MMRYIAAIDQGTTSTRCILFTRTGQMAGCAQKEHRQIYPHPGWVEHDPLEIWDCTCAVIRAVLQSSDAQAADIAAVGITNQRETTLAWDPATGEPYGNALVWQDTRTSPMVDSLASEGGIDRFRDLTGLPLATYFSASKMQWLLENRPGLREAGVRGEAIFGTMDSWIVWQLTGGKRGGAHVTDVTNASRTLLMDLGKLNWDSDLCAAFDIPQSMLPAIVSSIPESPYGHTQSDGPFGREIPVCGILGDQQAALFGQTCFEPGESKNTYGTGCFMLLNTGSTPIPSRHGLITTVAFQTGTDTPVYALEGSIAVAGSLVQWVRDNLGLIAHSAEIEKLARTVEDSGGVYFVPAFSGLFAPHWRSNARGVIVGLTGYANRGHLARAVLESTAFQTREIIDAMRNDSGMDIKFLKVDGGMVKNELLMQFQADVLNIPVIRPAVTETTALGAAYAAGLSSGFWSDWEELKRHGKKDKSWYPVMRREECCRRYRFWNKAVQRTLDWIED